MANIKSSEKDIRRIKSRTARNLVVSSRIKTLKKKVISAAKASDSTKLSTASGEFAAALDKAAKRHIVHPNKVNRAKSRMAKLAKAVANSQTGAAEAK